MNRLRFAVLLLLCLFLLAGCAAGPEKRDQPVLTCYQASFLRLFDTVSYIKGYAVSEEAFSAVSASFYDLLSEYHRLYDIYNDYDGIVNIKYINDHPGETLSVDQRIIDLLLFARDIAEETNGKTDITLGSVLSLWHEARTDSVDDPENAYLPDMDSLKEAAGHTGFDKVAIDTGNRTVCLLDPALKLDVGSIAKGFAVGKVCDIIEPGYIVSVGGNIVVTGPKGNTGEKWVIGVQSPTEQSGVYMHKVALDKGAVVSSGDYQRYFTVDGVSYHHIIDPDTLYPAERWRAVTVICDDSGWADALSTSLFLTDLETGKALLKKHGAEAVWVDSGNNCYYSDGYMAYIRK